MNDDTIIRLREVESRMSRIETSLASYIATSSSILPRIEEALAARSGEIERDKKLRIDVDNAHSSIRALETKTDAQIGALGARIDRAEKRQDRLYWFALGVLAVIQILIKGVPDHWLQVLMP